MSTLFQIHATINNLKPLIKELGSLWQAGDCILLMDETAAYYDWIKSYIDDFNSDEEAEDEIIDISNWYVLKDDLNAFNDSVKLNQNFENLNLLSDAQWVNLTHCVGRVVTLYSHT